MSKKSRFNWGNGVFLITYHVLLLALVPVYLVYFKLSWGIILSSVILLYLTGMSITGGYHRLFSHQTYKTNKFIEAVFLFFGSMATQGSALRWSNDHRLHHAHIDQDEDPYSVKRGFWYAHFLWMFESQPPIKEKVVKDLTRSKLVVFQHKHYELCMVVSNVIATLFVGWLTGDYFGAFVFAWLVRLFFLHHFTWFINSLAHYWGHQNYSTEHSAVDNYVLSLLTFGEGYHNYHHTFANDYRNGIRWYHFDPTKWLIWALSKLGLAHDLKKANEIKISQKMILEHKRALLEKIKSSFSSTQLELEAKATLYAESLMNKLSEMQELINRYKATKMDESALPSSIRVLTKEIGHLKKTLKREWRVWRKFSKNVMRLKNA
jgi:stearoyl-CoA desaturase (delta-9 desaturase)